MMDETLPDFESDSEPESVSLLKKHSKQETKLLKSDSDTYSVSKSNVKKCVETQQISPSFGARYQIDESLPDFESDSEPENESPLKKYSKQETKLLKSDSDTCSVSNDSLAKLYHDRPKAVPVRKFSKPKSDNKVSVLNSPETLPRKPSVRHDSVESKKQGVKRSSTGNEELTDVSPGKISCLSDKYDSVSITESFTISSIPTTKLHCSSGENGACSSNQEVPNQIEPDSGALSSITRRSQKDEDEVSFLMSIFPGVDTDWVKQEIKRLKLLQIPDYMDNVIDTIITEQTSVENEGHSSSNSSDVVVALGNTRLEADFDTVVSGGSSADYVSISDKKPSKNGKKGKGKATIKHKPILKYTDEVDALEVDDLEDDGIDMICDDRVSSSSLTCEACKQNKSHDKVVQCCDCHVVCNTCVEREVKVILSPDSQQTAVKCPCEYCKSNIPESQAKKILPTLIIELLEEKINKQVMDSISKMDDLVTCPSCSFPVIIDDGIKQFKCPYCQKKSCRYCKKLWLIPSMHVDCNHFTSSDQNLDNEDLGSPSYWHQMPEGDMDYRYILVLLEEHSGEFKHIKDLFGASMHRTNINSIRRIQNPRLWQKFCLARKHMKEDSGRNEVNEKQLFHGTVTSSMDGILKEGLDWRMCGENGVVYGQGTYFARSAMYSDRYARNDSSRQQFIPPCAFVQAINVGNMFQVQTPNPFSSVKGPIPNRNFVQQTNNQYLKQPFNFGFGHVQGDGGPQYLDNQAARQQDHSPGFQTPQTVSSSADKTVVTSVKDIIVPSKKYMFVARVLVGRSCIGQSGIRKPPVDENDSRKRHFNSCVDNVTHPCIFVIFDTAQSYPEYLIEYN